MEGRPNGMPAFREKLPESEAWKLVAYVRSLAGLVPHAAATSRSDEMSVKRPENLQPEQKR